MERADRDRLIELLQAAANQMSARGKADYWPGRFSTCAELGRFIADEARRLATGDESLVHELWPVFAPTCDWDDAGGSMELADGICRLLEAAERPGTA